MNCTVYELLLCSSHRTSRVWTFRLCDSPSESPEPVMLPPFSFLGNATEKIPIFLAYLVNLSNVADVCLGDEPKNFSLNFSLNFISKRRFSSFEVVSRFEIVSGDSSQTARNTINRVRIQLMRIDWVLIYWVLITCDSRVDSPTCTLSPGFGTPSRHQSAQCKCSSTSPPELFVALRRSPSLANLQIRR